MRLVWIQRIGNPMQYPLTSGPYRYAEEASGEFWLKHDSRYSGCRAVTVEAARDDYGCVVPSRPVRR